jgi:hypothetical protein
MYPRKNAQCSVSTILRYNSTWKMINSSVQSFGTTMNPLHENVVRYLLRFIRWSRVTVCWSLFLKSDWGNHVKTIDVARRIILQYTHDTCCSHLIEATMPRQQTWRIAVASWCLLLTSDWINHAETTDVARRIIWQQQSSRLLHKSISRRLNALITCYSNQNTDP